MAHIVVGLILFVLGIWGLLHNWHGFVDLLWALVPLLLVLGGLVAVVAGVSNFSRDSHTKHEEIGT
jgi:hypothetical protein